MTTSLAVHRLRLSNFRSYTTLDLGINASVVVLIGPNGAGKTNILEAISLLTPGRGMRHTTLAELGKSTSSDTAAIATDWAIHANITGLTGDVALGTGLQNGKRVVRINGETARGPGVLAHHMSALWLTPAMDRLFIEGSAGRRRFLDRMVFGLMPEHGAAASIYEKALRDRAKLLKERTPNTSWLDTLEHQMAEHGYHIANARVETLQRLQHTIDDDTSNIFPKAVLSLKGFLEEQIITHVDKESLQNLFLHNLKSGRARDMETGGATIGPHKTDLLVHHAGHGQPAQNCSTGEQKALLITLVLANTAEQRKRRNIAPILLLDEVAAHLDSNRRAALFHTLSAMGGQVWLTGTDQAFFNALKGTAEFHFVQESAIVT